MLATFIQISNSFGSVEIPQKYQINCWDHTFFYNQLEITRVGDLLHFKSTGLDHNIYKNLVKPGLDPKNGFDFETDFSIPVNTCRVAEGEMRILQCDKFSGSIQTTTRFANGTEVSNYNVTRAVVSLRKVTELKFLKGPAEGFELTITDSRNNTQNTLFLQSYIYTSEGEPINNCTLVAD